MENSAANYNVRSIEAAKLFAITTTPARTYASCRLAPAFSKP